MPTNIVNVRGEGGNIVEKELSSTEFVVKVESDLLSPEVTTQVEIENDGDISKTRDQCGHTQRSRVGDQGWTVRVQGIVTGTEREGNLSLARLRDEVASQESIKIRSDVISGRFEVSNVVITQSEDLVSIQSEDTIGEESAFEFQLQLGESASE